MTESELFERARNAAIRFISYRPRSEAEVRERLRRRFPAPLTDAVVADLVDCSLIDDAEFARAWTDSRSALNPKSANAVRRELLAKGVSKDVAQDAVSGIDDADEALRAGRKFARPLQEADYQTFRKKLWGRLQRRGFGQSITSRAISTIWEELRGCGSPTEAEDR